MISTIDRLVTMANQIGRFFAHRPEDQAVEGIAEHIRMFWDPRMRAAFRTHTEAGGAGLERLPLLAARMLITDCVVPSDSNPLEGMAPGAVTSPDPNKDPNTPG